MRGLSQRLKLMLRAILPEDINRRKDGMQQLYYSNWLQEHSKL